MILADRGIEAGRQTSGSCRWRFQELCTHSRKGKGALLSTAAAAAAAAAAVANALIDSQTACR